MIKSSLLGLVGAEKELIPGGSQGIFTYIFVGSRTECRIIVMGMWDMQKLPKISIITPTLNARETIEACLSSVKNQTYKNKEHLIIDGQSTDGTLEIIKRYVEKYPHLKWVSEKDDGIYDAMNKGIDLSSGDWLYFLGSDDIFYSDTVLHEIFSKTEISKYDIIYGNVKFGNMEQLYDGPFSRLKLLQKNLCHQAIFTRRTIFDRIGKFDINFNVCADWVFNMRWYNKEDIRHRYIEMAIAKYNSDGYSSTNQDMLFIKDRDALIEANFPIEYSINDKNLRDQCQQLQDNDRKISELEDKLRSLLASRSWRVTMPLRKIKHYILNWRKIYTLW